MTVCHDARKGRYIGSHWPNHVRASALLDVLCGGFSESGFVVRALACSQAPRPPKGGTTNRGVHALFSRQRPQIRLRPVAITLYDLVPRTERPDNDQLLGRFLEYVEARRLQLYPAQEAAILELFEEKNVVLNTPTGSGKSLVAAALHFKAMAQGKRSVYTFPIKALVNEKWLDLCREFGPDNVGLSTGDASVNRDAPILCCTAEILANIALRQGPEANLQEVIIDEFHYYADRDRGV